MSRALRITLLMLMHTTRKIPLIRLFKPSKLYTTLSVRYSLVWGANPFCEALLTLHGLCPLSVAMHTTCTAGNSVTDDHVAPTPPLVSFSQREDLALPYGRRSKTNRSV
uniref:Uncharacterized protein n=1 Tax=Timema cristinae TaxID=61476 RepID=A0A7R9DJ77_TIMCR|nr:unnamed protein product [Timema cristinae]